MGMGFELVGIISACAYFGQMVDQQYHLNGIAMAVIMMLGLAGWIVHIIKMTRQIDRIEDQKKDQ